MTTTTTSAGEYTLSSGVRSERWPGDPLWEVRYRVLLNGKEVASIFDSTSYNGKLSVSMNGIRWAGRQSADHLDPTFHDFVHGNGDLDSAFAATVRRCDRIVEWRSKLPC
jgi:hypothetical protein